MTTKNQGIGLLLLLFGIAIACTRYYQLSPNVRGTFTNAEEILAADTLRQTFFKVHFKNGDLCLLDEWSFNAGQKLVSGTGTRFDFNRDTIAHGPLDFPVDDIAIIETNDTTQIMAKDKEVLSSLTVLSVLNTVGALLCVINPKACFGSCPTFYTDPGASVFAARAEGFSRSLTPSMERTDIDPLGKSSTENRFELTMKNEALETHVVNHIAIRAVPHKKNEVVFHDPAHQFYRCLPPYPYTEANIDGQPANDLLCAVDGQEYMSRTDSFDLTRQEHLVFSFAQLPEQDYGVVLHFRQSLLSTFMLYTAYGYMGADVGRYMALFERSGILVNSTKHLYQQIEHIKLQAWSHHGQRWENVGRLTETGPIAPNAMLLPLPRRYIRHGKARIKLIATRGMWRFDQVALAPVLAKAEPTIHTAEEIETISGNQAYVSELAIADDDYLVTFPGDEYRFVFALPTLPDGMTNALFLEARGYYLEWMRKEWLVEQNPQRLQDMLRNDRTVWRQLAQEYKLMEMEMDDVFWQSTYAKNQ